MVLDNYSLYLLSAATSSLVLCGINHISFPRHSGELVENLVKTASFPAFADAIPCTDPEILDDVSGLVLLLHDSTF